MGLLPEDVRVTGRDRMDASVRTNVIAVSMDSSGLGANTGDSGRAGPSKRADEVAAYFGASDELAEQRDNVYGCLDHQNGTRTNKTLPVRTTYCERDSSPRSVHDHVVRPH